MSYPNYFNPRGWRLLEGDPEALKASIAGGTVSQTQEVQDAWQDISDHIIVSIDLFNEMVLLDTGITQVVFQANPELDERQMVLNMKVNQRSYGKTGPQGGPNNWDAIQAELDRVKAIFTTLVETDIGFVVGETVSSRTPHDMMFKIGLTQRLPADQRKLIPGEIHHLKPPKRVRVRGIADELPRA